MNDAIKQRLRDQFVQLDPVRLLHDIRSAQHWHVNAQVCGSCWQPELRKQLISMTI
ncbi:MAG: hypothetical protein KIT60_13130 [Burkholderiaceae bacterium]|nr:hypothetical protein [Burkholderiaceae bacterium]